MILYEGPNIRGEQIVVLLKADSKNSKTGNIPSIWVFVPDMNPWDVINTGLDASVCGDCQHRKGGTARRCYTHGNTMRALTGMVRAHAAGKYPRIDSAYHPLMVAKQSGANALRSTAYGDMALVPRDVWEKVNLARIEAGLGVRGYTAQWRHAHATHLRTTHMASVSNTLQAAEAEALGWRYFLSSKTEVVRGDKGPINCPASKEAGHITTCNRCPMCSGNTLNAPSVWIKEH